ncbi:MAG: tetratricopeptide repeat protein [Desulfosalsimonadaceae bacterium]
MDLRLYAKICFIALVLSGCHLFGNCCRLQAEEGAQRFGQPSVRADQLFDYARRCFMQEDYESAVYEFRRFLHFFPDEPRADAANFYISRSYFRMERYEKALSAYRKTARKYPESKYATRSRFAVARCYQRLNDPQAAKEVLYQLIRKAGQRSVRDKARYRLAWIFLEKGNTGHARSWLARISPAGRRTYPVDELLAEMEKTDTLDRKSPVLAGIFSIIPGGGYLYCGRYQDAAVAFFVNAALMGASYESFESDLEVLGSLLALVDLGFYSGSIYGGISSAHKYNRAEYRRFIEEVKSRHFSAGLIRSQGSKAFELSFHLRF